MMVETKMPKQHGEHGVYRPGMKCPGCGMSNWHIGLASAECGKCSLALELPRGTRPGGTFRSGQ